MANISDTPLKDEFAVPEDEKTKPKGFPRLILGFKWSQWLGELVSQLNKAPKVEAKVRLAAGSTGSVGTTPFSLDTVPAGIYRVGFRFRITQVATVSSALQFFVSYTNDTLALNAVSANETGNLTTSVQAGSLLIRVDANTAISWGLTYASVGATPMQYEMDTFLEAVALDTV